MKKLFLSLIFILSLIQCELYHSENDIVIINYNINIHITGNCSNIEIICIDFASFVDVTLQDYNYYQVLPVAESDHLKITYYLIKKIDDASFFQADLKIDNNIVDSIYITEFDKSFELSYTF